MQKKMAVLIAAAMLALSAAGWAATTIVPSDNTVTSAKIVDLAITNADIANTTITGGKLVNATITATQLASGAVTDAKIVNVNASKLFGQISTSRLRVGTTAGTVAAGNHTHTTANVIGLDAILASKAEASALAAKADVSALSAKADITHDHDAIYQKKYSNVIVVAKNGGDFTNPASALNSITDASASNPYLIKIMPGIYDIGTNLLEAKSYVDIEGSGINNTVISGASYPLIINQWSSVYSVGSAVDHTELSKLTIENRGGVGESVSTGIIVLGGAANVHDVSLKLTAMTENVGIDIFGGSVNGKNILIDTTNEGWSYGVYNRNGSNNKFENITVVKADVAYYNFTGSSSIKNLNTISQCWSKGVVNQGDMIIENSNIISRVYGVQAVGNSTKIYNSIITGPTAIVAYDSSHIVNSQFNGDFNKAGNTVKCIGAYDTNLNPITCQ